MTPQTAAPTQSPTAATRPSWDARCAAGCGAPVLEGGQTCTACTLALVDAESARPAARMTERMTERQWQAQAHDLLRALGYVLGFRGTTQ